MRVRCTEIQWDTSDTDGPIPKLPKTMTFVVPDFGQDEEDSQRANEQLAEELAEKMSEATGFCVYGFSHRII